MNSRILTIEGLKIVVSDIVGMFSHEEWSLIEKASYNKSSEIRTSNEDEIVAKKSAQAFLNYFGKENWNKIITEVNKHALSDFKKD